MSRDCLAGRVARGYTTRRVGGGDAPGTLPADALMTATAPLSYTAGLSLRNLSAGWTRANFGSGVAPPPAAAAGGVGSTGQRWADYDAAKAAEQALRQVLGAPNSASSW